MAAEFSSLADRFGGSRIGDPPLGREEIIQLISLRRNANHRVADGEHSRNEESDRDIDIVNYIRFLVGRGGQPGTLLSHFSSELKDIVRDVINTSSTAHDENVIREILERCHNESARPSGTLHSDHYYIPLDEAALGWPYDSDYEAEAYYEHEDRLDLDENYAKRFGEECRQRWERKEKRQELWVDVWVQALDKCGEYLPEPILFNPDSVGNSSRHQE